LPEQPPVDAEGGERGDRPINRDPRRDEGRGAPPSSRWPDVSLAHRDSSFGCGRLSAPGPSYVKDGRKTYAPHSSFPGLLRDKPCEAKTTAPRLGPMCRGRLGCRSGAPSTAARRG